MYLTKTKPLDTRQTRPRVRQYPPRRLRLQWSDSLVNAP